MPELRRHANPDALDAANPSTLTKSRGRLFRFTVEAHGEQLARARVEVQRTRAVVRQAVDGCRAIMRVCPAVVRLRDPLRGAPWWHERTSGRTVRYFAGLLAAAITAHVEALRGLGRAQRCGARCRDGHGCRAPRVEGKRRCKLHGGRSTGPRTAEGRARAAEALARVNAARSTGSSSATRSRTREPRPSVLEIARGVLVATLARSRRPRRSPRVSTWNPTRDGHWNGTERRTARLRAQLAATRAELLRRAVDGCRAPAST